jgi:hypothetical protein
VSDERKPPELHPEGLTEEELAEHEGVELPERQAMSAIGDIAIPLDPDMAADALLAQDELADPDEPTSG